MWGDGLMWDEFKWTKPEKNYSTLIMWAIIIGAIVIATIIILVCYFDYKKH